MTAIDPSKPVDVVALGAAIVDALASVEDGFLVEHDVAKGAMTLVDHARAEAVHRGVREAREISGGSAANTVAGLASLGARVAFVGKIKEDAAGGLFREDIRRIGVAFDTAPFAANAPGATARCLVLVTPDAQRSMLTDLGVSGLLTVDDLPIETLAQAKIVYLEGYLWDHVETKRAFSAAAAAAKEAGGAVALTLSDAFCVDRHRDSFKELVANQVDILFANEAEILSLYETDDFSAAAAAAARDAPIAVITRSEKGCVVLSDGERHDVAAAPIGALVDTTGAGDLFAAGFLFGLVRGADLQTCGRMGCLAASEVIQHLGARPEINLKALFEEHGLG
ncbi:MAG: adenosine kinase [Pseudomonadota bacterium]